MSILVPLTPRDIRFSTIFVEQIRKTHFEIAVEIDATAFLVLAFIRDDESPPGKYGGKALAMRRLALTLNISRRRLRDVLELMAHIGLIRVTFNDKQYSDVEIHPDVLRIIDPKGSKITSPEIQESIRRILDHMDERGDAMDPLQGFQGHVRFGEREIPRLLETRTDEPTPSPLFREARDEAVRGPKRETLKDAAKRERAERDQLSNRFIRRCADVWTRGQIILGRMKATDPVPPSWYGPEPRKLSEGDRKKYNVLKTHFLRYGTRRVGLAWAMFCGSASIKPTFADGKKRPYVHWVGEDKSPMAFDKHLMAVFTDEVFQNDLEDPGIVKQVAETYSEDLMAFNGDENLPIAGAAR